MMVVAMHDLRPKFAMAFGSGAGSNRFDLFGRLRIWVHFDCDIAKSASFLAPRPEKKNNWPAAAFVRATSALGFSLQAPSPDLPPNQGLATGRVPLWDAHTEWFSVAAGSPASIVKDHKGEALTGWLKIETQSDLRLEFGAGSDEPLSFHVGLIDQLTVSNNTEMVSYVHMRNRYRLRRAIFDLVKR